MFTLSDIFIGEYPLSQSFGSNPEAYARFNIRGHNGIDIACPSGTQVVAGTDGWVKKIAYEKNGYGNYIVIVHNGFYTRYAHLNNTVVSVGDRVVTGQLIGYTNNSGNSTGPHLHFEIVPCDDNGNEIENGNGFAGRINPMDTARVTWNIVNLKEPAVKKIEGSVNEQEFQQAKDDRNSNWDMAREMMTYMGLSMTDQRDRNIQLVKGRVDIMRDETVQAKKEAAEWEKKYDEERDKVEDLNAAISKVSGENHDDSKKAYSLEKELKASEMINKEVAKEMGVSYNASDKTKVLDQIMTKLFEWKETLKALPAAPPPPEPSTPDTISPDINVSAVSSDPRYSQGSSADIPRPFTLHKTSILQDVPLMILGYKWLWSFK